MSPDFAGLIETWWGGGQQGSPFSALIGQASNICIGGNPPYGAGDFFSLYPKFGGATSPVPGTINGAIVSDVPGTQGLSLMVGSPVVGPPTFAGVPIIPGGTFIIAISSDGTQLTLNQPGTATTPITLTVWNPANYLVPYQALSLFIRLASASIQYCRWLDDWQMGMNLFIAHFATLWLQSEGSSCTDPGRAAASGLARGITIAKSVGPVSQGLQPVTGLESWAAWNLTTYGLQLATLAKLVGGVAGMYIY